MHYCRRHGLVNINVIVNVAAMQPDLCVMENNVPRLFSDIVIKCAVN